MKSKKKTLLSAVLAIVLCMSLIAGSTFALFTSESKVNIAVTSGKVEVNAEIKGLTLYSATTENTGSVAGTIASGNHAGTYYYESVSPNFTNGGTAVLSDENGTLTLDRVTPGDKVNFNVGIANESNVNIKYRVIVNVTSGLKLFNALKVKIDGTSLTGVSRTGAWTSLAAKGKISDIPVEIYLPIEAGNEYQNLSTAMTISVEAVQSNAKTVDGTLTSTIETEPVAVAVSGSQTTAAIPPISDSDNLVTVTIPANTLLTTETDTSLMVKVTPQDTLSNAVITVLNNNPAKASASYDVSVLKIVSTTTGDETTTTTSDAIASNNDKPITVTMFVGAGLKGVELYHYDDVSGVTTPITVFDYDIDSGYITFETTSFSEYTVVYNTDYAKETFDEQGKSTGIVVYEATETAGVYTTTDENDEEVYVTVTTDETTGEATEEVSDYIIVTGNDGVEFIKYIDGDLYIYDMTNYTGTEYTVPENITGLGGSSFSGNTTIKTLTFTNQIDSAYKALQGNSSITTVNFGSMTSIPNRMFYGCTGIKNIVIPATVNRIEDFAFYGNTTIETIIAKDLEYVGYKAFDACSALKILDIGGENVEIMGWAGRQVASIETIIIRGANASVNLDYAPAGQAKGAFVFCKTQQSSNPNTMTGVNFYVVNDTVAEQFNAELNIESATRKAIVSVSDAAQLNATLELGNLAIFTNDISVEANIVAPYGNNIGVLQANGGIIDGNGYTLSVTGSGDTYAIMTKGGIIENLTIDCARRGVVTMNPNQDLILYNIISGGELGVGYSLNTAEHGYVHINAIDCSFIGWSSFAGMESVIFSNCYFGQGYYWNDFGYSDVYGRLVRPYVNTTFENCTFERGFYVDLSALGNDQTVTFANCTANDAVITADNIVDVAYANDEDITATETIFYELPSGRTLKDCVVFE